MVCILASWKRQGDKANLLLVVHLFITQVLIERLSGSFLQLPSILVHVFFYNRICKLVIFN